MIARGNVTVMCGLLAAVFSTSCSVADIRVWTDSQVGGIESPGGDFVMPYRYFLPRDYDPAESYPMVLWLHGAGERGTDNILNVSRVIDDLIVATDVDYPAILVAPQLAAGGWSPANPQDLTTSIVDRFLNDFPVDSDRLYLMGASMGGFGTMAYLTLYNVDDPGGTRFAAGAPTAGAFVRDSAAEFLSDTPIWLSHNTGDPTVSFVSSLTTYNRLVGLPSDTPFRANVRGGGGNGPLAEMGRTRFTAYDRSGHDSWSAILSAPDFYDWMFSQSLRIPEPSSGMLALVALSAVGRRSQTTLRR